MWWLLGLVGAVVILARIYLENHYSYWKKQGVPTPTPRYFLGNLGESLIFKKSLSQIYTEIYQKFQGKNYVGYYKFMKPGLIIRNPDIVKDVLMVNFSSFHDNDFYIDEKHDLIFGKNPFALTGETWKTVRNQVSPAFSGGKVKASTPLLMENCEKMRKYILNSKEAINGTGLEAKELASKYTCENVASCAFGLNGGCFTDEDAEFRDIGKKLTQPSIANGLRMLCLFAMPPVTKIFKVQFFPTEVTNFLKNVVKQTLTYREANNIDRKDFLDVMNKMRAKIKNDSQFSEDDITAHAGGFFIDGFETSSIVISFALYELAAHPESQERLRKEIHEVIARDGSLNHDNVSEMVFLENFMKENLRMNMPLLAMTKICTKPFKLPPVNEDNTGPEITVQPGTPIIIPVFGIHTDNTYYKDAEKFDPDRFSNGQMEGQHKYTYLPFSEGPRICLGMKFGLLQSKMAVATVVSNFVVKVNPKTKLPLQIDPRFFLKAPIGGLWLDMHPVEKKFNRIVKLDVIHTFF